jgi:hypothetical protein
MLLRSYTDEFGLSVKGMHYEIKCKPGCLGCRLAATDEAEQMEDYNLQAFCRHVVFLLKKPFLR